VTEPEIVKALAHPLRVQILTALEHRTASPNQLATELGMPLGNVSYHVRMLSKLGLIRLVSRRQRRGAVEHFYKAEARPVIGDDVWAQVPDIVKSRMVQAGLTGTMAMIASAARDGGFNHDDAHLSRSSFEVDEEAWRACSQEVSALFERLREITAQTAERLADAPLDHDRKRASVVLMLFEGGEPVAPVEPAAAAAPTRRRGRAVAR
jgi:DNA-binding transcriptional ArsR family regulator